MLADQSVSVGKVRKFKFRIKKQFDNIEKLGKGGLDKVLAGTNKHGNFRYAVKCIRIKCNAKQYENTMREIGFLSKL